MMKISTFLFLIYSSVVIQGSYNSHLSDAWYSSKSKVLRTTLQALQRQARAQYSSHLQVSKIKGFMVPHAAYDYSGAVATSAYQNIVPGLFKRVIILGPAHHVSFQGVALPGASYNSFRNILGKVPLDVTALKGLHKDSSGLFFRSQKIHETEHSIEIQIPLIQKYCGPCMIVPLLVGSVTPAQMDQIVDALQKYVDDTTLLIVSSDLTHYGAAFEYTPFTSQVADRIIDLDSQMVQKIQNLDSVAFQSCVHKTGAPVCGVHAIAIFLKLLKHNYPDICSYVTAYDRSSKKEQNPEHSVSYAAVVFSAQTQDMLPLTDRLTGYEKGILKDLVRLNLADYVQRDRITCQPSGVLTKALRSRCGAFVTLYAPGHVMRGCVGTVQAVKPLYQTVCEMSRAAAVDDHRFTPISGAELSDLSYTISVVTKPKRVDSYRDIVPASDGVVMRQGSASAIFLPKVAREFGWDLKTLLEQLCLKAGIAQDSYQNSSTQFEVFQTIEI